MKILIVDDDAVNVKLIESMLKNENYEILKAYSGKESLEKIKESPDIVLLDIMMPEISGIEVLEKIKKMNENIIVIMLTAVVDLDIVIDVMKKGAFDYLRKPIEKEGLIKIIKKAEEIKGEREKKEFQIYDIFIIKSSGLILFHNTYNISLSIIDTMIDRDILPAMLTIIKEIIQKAFVLKNGELNTLEYGGYKILIEEDKEIFIVIIGKGENEKIRKEMKNVISDINLDGLFKGDYFNPEIKEKIEKKIFEYLGNWIKK